MEAQFVKVVQGNTGCVLLKYNARVCYSGGAVGRCKLTRTHDDGAVVPKRAAK